MTEEKTVATITEKDLANSDQETVRNLIHFFHGKPDSDYELFTDPVLITLDDLSALNDQVLSKIENHKSENLCKISISLSENKVKEFSSWEEFKKADWRIHHVTKNLSITWDFFMTLPEFVAPQRHSLKVKIVSDARGEEFLPALFFSNPDKYEDIANKSGTVLARVDFINHRLGQELLNIVKEWNNSLPKRKTLYDKIQRAMLSGQWFVTYTIMVGITLIYTYGASKYLDSASAAAKNTILLSSIVILSGYVAIYAARDFSETMYYGILKLLRKHTLPRTKLTNGDAQKYQEKQDKQNRGVIIVFLRLAVGLALNILGGILVVYF